MTPRDWAEEPWTKLFTRDSPRWCRLSLAARGLYCLLQRAADRSGRIEVDAAVGSDAADAVAHHLRAPASAIERPLAELLAAGYVVATSGWLSLPEHIEQQATRSSGSQRSRDSRAGNVKNTGKSEKAQRDATRCNAEQRDATIDQIDQIDQIIDRSDRSEQSAGARPREATAAAKAKAMTADPRAQAIADALAAEPRFAALDHAQVAGALLGALGALGLSATSEHAAQAVARAALECEAGAPERRQRQLLGWALRDAVSPRPRGGSSQAHAVQGSGEDLDKFTANLLAGRPAWQ